MKALYNKLKNYSYEDFLSSERSDRQFLAIERLETFFKDKELFLALIISNSLICYQLSGTGERYWEEFSIYFSKKDISFSSLIDELGIFIKNSKNNKRFVDTKIKRLEKLKSFIISFKGKAEYYYQNMSILRDDLSLTMGQKNNAKTIVFAIKMFSYGARIVFTELSYPKEIFIPIDSRLKKIFEVYKEEYIDIELFYLNLSEKLDIPMLLLDSFLWVNYDTLIKK